MFLRARPTHPRFSPLPLPSAADWGPHVRGLSRSPVRATIGRDAARQSEPGPPLPRLTPPHGARRHPPISLPSHRMAAAYKKGGAPPTPPPLRALSSTPEHTPPPSFTGDAHHRPQALKPPSLRRHAGVPLPSPFR
jgi:hypothetical protein